MSIERVTVAEQRFLHWLSWGALAAATLFVCAACWKLWQTQGRMEILYQGRTHMLPLGMRILLAIPAIVFAILPVVVAAACIGVQLRFPSRVVTTLFHLFVLGIGLGCLLIARDLVMESVMTQAFGR